MLQSSVPAHPTLSVEGPRSLELLQEACASMLPTSDERRTDLQHLCHAYSASMHRAIDNKCIMDLDEHDMFTRKTYALLVSMAPDVPAEASRIKQALASLARVSALCTVHPSQPPLLPLHSWSKSVSSYAAAAHRRPADAPPVSPR